MKSSKVGRKIVGKTGKAVCDFKMIEDGDRILVALSGGKDSWTLLNALAELRRYSPVKYELDAVTVQPGFPGFRTDRVEEYCKAQGFNHWVEQSQIYNIVEAKKDPRDSYCAFCARLRRGILYSLARERGYTKIALGHHADDLIETLLLAQFFTGEIKSMPPVLKADDGVNTVIRPLCLVFEEDIVAFAMESEFPVVCCGCPVCSDLGQKRRRVKSLLKELEAEHPGIKSSMLSSLGRVRQRFLLSPFPEEE